MFAIPVLSDSTEMLLTGSPAPLWKWAKLDSIYSQMTRFWKMKMKHTLMNEEWNAENELHLLMQKVLKERRKEFRTDRVRFFTKE